MAATLSDNNTPRQPKAAREGTQASHVFPEDEKQMRIFSYFLERRRIGFVTAWCLPQGISREVRELSKVPADGTEIAPRNQSFSLYVTNMFEFHQKTLETRPEYFRVKRR